MITSNWKLKYYRVIPVLLIPLTIALSLWFAQNETVVTIVGILLFLLICSWLVSKFEWQHTLIMILAVLLPFSFEITAGNGFNVNVPSEPLLGIAIFSIGFDFLRKPGSLKQFIGTENVWVFPYLLSFVIGTIFSSMHWVSIKCTIVNVSYIMVFFIWQQQLFRAKPKLFPKLIGLYTISLFGVLAFSIYQLHRYDWNPATIKGIFRPFYKDHTIFGATSAFIATFWLAYGLTRKILTSKILFLILGFLFLGCVILSTSRAAIISVIVFGIVWLVLRMRIRLIKHVAIGVLTISLILFIFRSQVYNILIENKHLSHNSQLDYKEQLESSSNISSDISNRERINRWIAGFGMFTERPYMGFGPGTYQFVYIPFQRQEFMNRLTVHDPWHIPENSGGTAHSEYLLAISEMGIIGLIALFIMLGRWIWIAFEGSLRHPERTTIILIFAILSTYLFHALFNNFLTTDKVAFLFWGLAAWMVVYFKPKHVSNHGVL